MQWRSVLRAVEMHQMHRIYLRHNSKFILLLTLEFFGAHFWVCKSVYWSQKWCGYSPVVGCLHIKIKKMLHENWLIIWLTKKKITGVFCKKNFLVGRPPLYVTFSVRPSICPSLCPSVCPSVHCAAYLRNHTSSDHNFWRTYVKWWYLKAFFFIFFKILIFLAVRVVKGQKIGQNEK